MNQLYISAIKFPATGNAAATALRDFYMCHKLVYAAFPTKEAATAARVLFRFDLEGDIGYLYVQSLQPPDWSRLPEAIKSQVTGPVAYEIPTGNKLGFRLLAKPSLRIGKNDDPNKGKRVTVNHPAEQLAWLRRKGQECGFEIEDCQLLERVWHDSKRPERLPNGSPKPLYGVQFDGILVVTDPNKLKQAVRNGVGPQKGFGFGLLSLAPLK